ncbi:MAG: dienelactone hydrolase family protein [Gemmatimonadaceae bacterium]
MPRRLVALLLTVVATAAFISRPVQGPPLPAGATDAEARIKASPRHAEWATIKTSPTDSVVAWVVYPERRDKAPVVVVIHEIFGLSTWIRGVADQLAADGFIAIAPDLLTMKRAGNLTSEWSRDSATAAIRTLKSEDVQRDLSAVANYGMKLPAASQKYGVVGYCWGGSTSFTHAVVSADVDAAVVYYGTSPASQTLQSIKAPVLGLYGGNDARVNATIAPADSTMKALGKTYEHAIYEGAGHGFLRAQDGQDGANMTATKQAWPRTIQFFRKHLAS